MMKLEDPTPIDRTKAGEPVYDRDEVVRLAAELSGGGPTDVLSIRGRGSAGEAAQAAIGPTFPAATWKPTAEQYFRAWAPDFSTPLHGSSDLKQFAKNRRVFRERQEARMAADWGEIQKVTAPHSSQRQALARMGVPVMTPLSRAHVEAMKPKPWMNFGHAVEARVFPESGEVSPLLSESDEERADNRAASIRAHPDAGDFTRAPGAAYQVAHCWRDPESGIWLRMRLDCAYWSGDPARPTILDMKIWAGIRLRYLWSKITEMGADDQAALYLRGAMDLWGISAPWLLIIAGPQVGDKILVRVLPLRMIRDADERLSRTLGQLAEAYVTNDFRDPEESTQEVTKWMKH